MQYTLSDKDGQQICICNECQAFYVLENPNSFKHEKDCSYSQYLKNRENNIEKWGGWTRNVQDKFKSLSEDEIKKELKKTMLPCGVLICNIEGDFNFGSIIRSANALGISKVFYFGKKRYNKRSTVGTYHYTDITYINSLKDVKNLKNEYYFVGLENNIKKLTFDIHNYDWAPETLFVIGEENLGIPSDINELCEDFVEIKMCGSVRSLNAAVAASIAMYDYSKKIKSSFKIY